MTEKLNMILNLRRRLLLFACIALIGYLCAGVINFMLLHFGSEATPAKARIAAMLQDLLMLVVPAIVTAVLVTRRPADLLQIRASVPWPAVILALLALIAATPAMNCIIRWNESLSLPESLSGLESQMRQMEDAAAKSVGLLMGNGSVGDLVMAILIMGIAAGFSEELFFRGTFLRLLTTGRVGANAAVWIVAAVFSLLHFQMFGFVPRLLLGAFFGYLLVWTGNLWVPVMIHAANNIIYVVAQWTATRAGIEESPVDHLGTGADWPLAIASAVVTAAILYAIKRSTRKPCDGR